MQKVKHNFQVANQEILFGNVYMTQNSWQNCFTLFDHNLCLMFKLSTHAVLWTGCNSNWRLQSRISEIINTHGKIRSKTQRFPLIEKKLDLVLNKGKRKQERKGNRIITLDGERIARRSNDNMTLVSETSHKQNNCRNHKAALND